MTDAELIAEAGAVDPDTMWAEASLVRALATALAAHQWQPINHEHPPSFPVRLYGTRMGSAGYTDNEKMEATGRWSWQYNRWIISPGIGRYDGVFSPTHWMPLPAPPETKP